MTRRLAPWLSYYGTKYRIAPHYPRPEHDTIVEPFAGAASYASLYPDRRVVLCDLNEKLIAVWKFLIAATAEEILALPLLKPGETLDDLRCHQEGVWLIGWWTCAAAQGEPRRKPSPFFTVAAPSNPAKFWSERCRARIARQVHRIDHWQAHLCDYRAAPVSGASTWFVDPPYQDKGKCYTHGSDKLDFDALADWCRTRPGQVMVCENEGADWLPFERFLPSVGPRGRRSKEVLWCNDGWRMPVQEALAL